MSAKHTPGPWEFDESNYGANNTPGWGIVDTARGASVGVTVHAPANREDGQFADEARATALLIAAAPDLLDALKCARVHVARYLDEVGPCDHSVNICVCGIKETIDQVDAAIAKAEGEKETEAAP